MADQYMEDEPGGGLPTDDMMIKETRPSTKGVSLEAKQSADIRAKLMEMIQAREAEKSGWGAIMERLAISGGPGSFQDRLAKYNTAQQAREEDIYNKRMGVAQLDTEQARLAQARAQAQQQAQQFKGMLGGPEGATAPGAAAGVPPGAAAAYNSLTPQEKQSFLALYQANPQAAIKALLARQAPLKPTDLERNVGLLTGLSEEQKQNILLSNIAPNVGEMVTVPDPANPGYSKQVTKLEAQRLALGQGQPPPSGPLSTAAPPAAAVELSPVAPLDISGGPLSQKNVPPTDLNELSRYNEAKLDAINAQKGALPFQDDTVVAEAPPVVVAKPPAAAPVVVAKPPAAAAVPKGKNIYPRTDPQWAPEEARLAKEAADVAENIRKERETSRQKDLDIERSAKTEEGKLVVKKADEEQTALSARASEGAEMVPYAQRIASSVETISKTAPKTLGMLNQSKISSAILRFIDEGISAGTVGTLTIPGLKNLVVQLNPAIVRDQRSDGSNPTLEAYQTLITDAARLSLAYARIVNKGMGSMSNYERQIIRDAVGTDPYRTGKKGLLSAAKVVECEAANAAEQQELWSRMKKAGKTWSEYKDSTYLAELKKTQQKRTAAAMGVKQ
jgi:hypothetical protein